jgi:kynurenine 3-monooxygenase
MRDSVLDPRFGLKKKLGFQLELAYPAQFIPRYSMVMFHRIPYSQAKQRGAIQQGILDELTGGVDSIEQVDMLRAGQLVQQRLELLSDSTLG